jgi:hypothetical protein
MEFRILGPEDGRLDLGRFERLRLEARGPPPPAAADRLCEALSLWRGPALAALADLHVLRSEIARLEELRLVPLRERLRGQLMLALYSPSP